MQRHIGQRGTSRNYTPPNYVLADIGFNNDWRIVSRGINLGKVRSQNLACLPADVRISLKRRIGPTYRIELIQRPFLQAVSGA